MTPRRNRRLDTVSDRIYRASVNFEAALLHLDVQRSQVRTLGAATFDGGRSGGGSHSDRTAAAMLALDRFEYRRRSLYDAIGSAEKAADVLDEAIREAYIGDDIDVDGPTTEDRPLCRGGQPDTWGDPSCGAHVEHFIRDDGSIGFRSEGLCSKHRSAKRRWEQQNREVA